VWDAVSHIATHVATVTARDPVPVHQGSQRVFRTTVEAGGGAEGGDNSDSLRSVVLARWVACAAIRHTCAAHWLRTHAATQMRRATRPLPKGADDAGDTLLQVDTNTNDSGHVITTTAVARDGRKHTLSYSTERVVGNGSFGVVFQVSAVYERGGARLGCRWRGRATWRESDGAARRNPWTRYTRRAGLRETVVLRCGS
jgi:hypothetical protein